MDHLESIMDPIEPTPSANEAPTGRGRRRSRRAFARRRRRTLTLALLLVSSIAVIAVALPMAMRWQGQSVPASSEQALSPKSAAALLVASAHQPSRPVFRHSVVPGGVHSAAEVVRAIATDPVVAAHYAGIDTSRLRVERLARPITAHVSYRIGDQVLWTQRKLQLAAGEEVITDGTTTLRARCGNMISTVRRTPQYAGEPAAAEFEETLEIAALTDEPITFASAAILPSAPSDPRGASAPNRVRRSVQIPAPGPLALLVFAIAAGMTGHLHRRHRLRQQRSQ